MPTYGEYETVGEPLAVANESGHVTTVWRARKSGTSTAGEFAIKVYSPHRKNTPGDSGEALDRDRGLEFLEGVKQLKKAQSEGARCLAPIHAFGTTADGVWFTTDYFQRGSLSAWISRRVNVDSAALRQIVACLVTGCLDLKRSRGNSHGNLKPTNVFLVGTTRPLRKTPMVLTDAHPAAPRKLAGLEGDDRRTADELLHQVMEAQDLRAIGEIILQLVEGRLVSSAYDYNYPVPRSNTWNNLGKDGERWRALCNQLLDPQLSLEVTHLEALAKQFPPGSGGGKVMVIVGVAGLVGLLGAAGFFALPSLRHWQNQRQEETTKATAQRFATAINAATNGRNQAQQDFENKNYDAALAQISNALKQCQEALANGTAAQVEPLQTQIGELKNTVAKAIADKQASEASATKAQRFDQAMNDATNAWKLAQTELANRSYDPALSQIGKAIQQGQAAQVISPTAQVKSLLNELGEFQKTVNAAIEQQKTQAALAGKAERYSKAMGDATNAWTQAQAELANQSYDTALARVGDALKSCDAAFRDGDSAEVARLRVALGNFRQTVNQARDDYQASASKADQFTKAMKQAKDDLAQAQTVFGSGDYDATLLQVTNALTACRTAAANAAVANGDSNKVGALQQTISKLGVAAQSAKAEKVAKAGWYDTAMKQATNAWTQAQTVFGNGDYDAALIQVTNALTACQTAVTNGNPEAVKSLQQTISKLGADVQLAKAAKLAKAGRYDTAMKQATNALAKAQTVFKSGDYDAALNQVTNALQAAEAALPDGDPKAVNQFQQVISQLGAEVQAAKTDKLAKAGRHDTAMTQATEARTKAETAFKSGDYDAALIQVTNALRACQTAQANGDTTDVKELQQAIVSLRADVVRAQVEQSDKAKRYFSAMALATNALAQAQTDLSGGNFAASLNQVTNALLACQTARTNGEVAPVNQFQQAVSKLVTEVLAAKLKSEFVNATNYFASANYPAASKLCLANAGNEQFDALKNQIAGEQQSLQTMTSQLGQGDYSFVKGLSVQKYKDKPPFVALLKEAEPQAGVFTSLGKLTNAPGNWAQVNSALSDPANGGFITKVGFNPFRDWVAKNDPVKQLNSELDLFKVWFKQLKPSPAIIDPATAQPATELPKGIPLTSYYTELDVLKGKYRQLEGSTSVHLKDIKAIESAMGNWD